MKRPLLLSTAEVARLLRVSVRTVCVWAECCELPGYKVGRQSRFRADAITNWLEKHQLSPTGGRKTVSSTPRSATAALAAGAAYRIHKKEL